MADEQPQSETPKYDALTDRQRAWVDELFVCGLNQTEASRRLGLKAPQQHGWRMSKNVDVRAAIEERLDQAAMSANEVLYRLSEQAAAPGADIITFHRVQRPTEVWVPAPEAIAHFQEQVEIEREVAKRLGLEGSALMAHDEHVAEIERRIVRIEVEAERDPSRMVKIDGPLYEGDEAAIDLKKLAGAGKLHLVKSIKVEKDGGTKVELYDAQAALKELAAIRGLKGPKGTKDDPKYYGLVDAVNFTTPQPGAPPPEPEDDDDEA